MEHNHVENTLGIDIIPLIIVVAPYWVEIKVQSSEGYIEGNSSYSPLGNCGTSFTHLKEGLYIVSAESISEEHTIDSGIVLIDLTKDSYVSLVVHEVKD